MTATASSLSHLLKTRIGLRKEIEAISRDLRIKREALAETDADLRRLLEESGLDRVSKDGMQASLKEVVGVRITNWDEFYAHIAQNNAFHLLQRRTARKPFEELHALGEGVPGTETYTYRDLTVRKTTTA